LFWRKAPGKVLDAVSTAIHGDAVAMNASNQRRGFLRPLNLIVKCFI